MHTPPGPKGDPALGNTRQFTRDPLGFMEACRDAYRDLAWFSLGPYEGVLVTDPEAIEQVLVSDADAYRKPKFLSSPTDTIGEKITLTLTNVGNEPRGIGEKYKYNIAREDDGWEPVFYTHPDVGGTDIGVTVHPDGGFRLLFTVSQDGLERQNDGNPSYYVCSSLPAGEYRFEFFGVEDALAVTFTVQNV
jgi:hypothetical protein